MNTVKTNVTTSIGFLIGMGAWSISFITLIWGYGFYRLRLGPWLSSYVGRNAIGIAVANTIMLLLSSWMLHKFVSVRRKTLLVLGIVMGMLFVKGQWDLWSMLIDRGLTLQSNIAGSFFYLLTGFHAVHVLIGIVILFVFGIQCARTETSMNGEERFNLALKFWDLLLIFWLVLFVLIFVIQ